MLYIQTGNNLLPKVQIGAPLKLKLTNQVTKKYVDLDVTDTSESNYYYKFSLSALLLADLITGQYDYEVLDANTNILANGIALYGEYIAPDGSTYQTLLDIITYN